jgi:hypothetical protein
VDYPGAILLKSCTETSRKAVIPFDNMLARAEMHFERFAASAHGTGVARCTDASFVRKCSGTTEGDAVYVKGDEAIYVRNEQQVFTRLDRVVDRNKKYLAWLLLWVQFEIEDCKVELLPEAASVQMLPPPALSSPAFPGAIDSPLCPSAPAFVPQAREEDTLARGKGNVMGTSQPTQPWISTNEDGLLVKEEDEEEWIFLRCHRKSSRPTTTAAPAPEQLPVASSTLPPRVASYLSVGAR